MSDFMLDTLLLFGIFAALALNVGLLLGILFFLLKLNGRLARGMMSGGAVAAPPPPRPSFVAELKKELRQVIGKVLE